MALDRFQDWPIVLGVVLGTLLVFARLPSAGFLDFDDPIYVSENPHVLSGLSRQGVVWAFTTSAAAYWHPVTWLSLQLDASLFGPGPAGFHITNVALHAINAVLVFQVMRRLTGARWPSAVVAALFAWHPLHVESVAWVCERKDLLSTFFGLLTLLAFIAYVEQPTCGRYAAMLVAFTLSLMAKPMLVTLPCVLLLLDYWPLRRWPGQLAAVSTWRLLLEKLPLFVLAGLSSLVIFVTQRHLGAVRSLEWVTLSGRCANALLAYVTYLRQVFWPTGLAVFYPHPKPNLFDPAVLMATLALATISALVFALARRQPYLPVGWLWFLGTLVPVLGIVQVGNQGRADRFTYVPLVGIFVALAWAAAALVQRWPLARTPAVVGGWAVLLCCAALSWVQTGYWRDSETMWRHDVQVAPNVLAWNHLGEFLVKSGRVEEGLACYEEALAIDPASSLALYNRGAAQARLGRIGQAEADYKAAILANPHHAQPRISLGVLLAEQGRLTEAKAQYVEALQVDANRMDARVNLGVVLFTEGHTKAAYAELEEAVAHDPTSVPARNALGAVQTCLGLYAEAVASLQESIELDPRQASTWHELAQAQGLRGHWQDALTSSRMAVRLAPENGEMRGHLAFCLSQLGDMESARREFDMSFLGELGWPQRLARVAWEGATHADSVQRDGRQLVYIAQQCCRATGDRDPELLDILAAAHAHAGEYEQALAAATTALDRASGRDELAVAIRARRKLYESKLPYRDRAR